MRSAPLAELIVRLGIQAVDADLDTVYADGLQVFGAVFIQQPAVGDAVDVELVRVDGLDDLVVILVHERLPAIELKPRQPQFVGLAHQIFDGIRGQDAAVIPFLCLQTLDGAMPACHVAGIVVLHLNNRDALAAAYLFIELHYLFIDVGFFFLELIPFALFVS